MTQTNDTKYGQTVVGVFEDVTTAERAINDLKVAGFTPDTISVVTKDRTDQHNLDDVAGNKAGEGALVGALGGGTLGAVLGWLLAGGAALIPGVGPVIAAGIFGATVTGALVGGALGSISAALVGQGIPEDEAAEYEEHVRGGRTLLSIKAANGQLLESALDVFDRNGATGIRYYNEGQTGPGRVYTRGTMTETSSDSAVTTPTDRDWTSSSTTTTTTNTTATDADNVSKVDERDYRAMSSDTATPDYRDETYRTADRTSREDARSIDYTDKPLDSSTLPDQGQGTTTRGGVLNDGIEPLGTGLPQRDPETNLPLGYDNKGSRNEPRPMTDI